MPGLEYNEYNELLDILEEYNSNYSNAHASHWNKIYIEGLRRMDEDARKRQIEAFCKQGVDEVLYAFEIVNLPEEKYNKLRDIVKCLN